MTSSRVFAAVIGLPEVREEWFAEGFGALFGVSDVELFAEEGIAVASAGPFARDDGGRFVVAGDVRFDRAGSLRARLGTEERDHRRLLVTAFERWGEECLDHLRGDFSFVLLDRERRRLFCARDQFGQRPLFYYRSGPLLALSNSIAWLRYHFPDSASPDREAFGDYLLFGSPLDPSRTMFETVRRLPAGHRMILANGEPFIRRYWQLEPPRPLRYRRQGDYLEHFVEELDRAVADRLTSGSATVLMSGGLDSTAIALAASRVARRERPDLSLSALTVVDAHLADDREGELAAAAAAALRIPHRLFEAGGFRMFERYREHVRYVQDPANVPLTAQYPAVLAAAGEGGSVVLSGFGGDPLMVRRTSWFWRQLRRGRVIPLAGGLFAYALIHRALPAIGLRTFLRTGGRKPPEGPAIPRWIRPEIVREWNLEARVDEAERLRVARRPMGEVERPEAFEMMADPVWSLFFDFDFAEALRVGATSRMPLFDLTLVESLLAMPAVPWFGNKELFRAAALGSLPEKVRLRAKTPLVGDPVAARLERDVEIFSVWLEEPAVGQILDVRVIRRGVQLGAEAGAAAVEQFDPRPLAVAAWIFENTANAGLL
jgi:asparagine synthase (glutamine-hydrolysing)